MCGFVGALQHSERYGFGWIDQAAQSISHRGPDDSGIWVDSSCGIGLAHRRLAIVDLSPAGHQPMPSICGRYVIAFNGEIYNHLKLRRELERDGVAPMWRGHSDTETLLAGFASWGVRATLLRCAGMFAFALWDKTTQLLTLGRDRMGEKPLYYGWQGAARNASFLFGSELSALRCHPAFQAAINRDALALYMRHNCIGGAHSIYSGIHKLEPGRLLTVSREAPEPLIQAWWSGVETALHGVAHQFGGSPDEAVVALEDLLSDAIGQQMMADVPLGAFLSGGIDSSTVVALMQAQSLRPVKTFSIGFNEQGYNEAVHAKAVAKHLGTDHTELYVTPEQALAVIPKIPSLYSEPFADSSQIPTLLVSQLARKDVAVSLSGDAGDELFGGYNRYQMTATAWNKLKKCPRGIRKMLSEAILGLSPQGWNSVADKFSLGNRWADVGYKLHKGAGVFSAASAYELYLGLVSQWADPEGVVLGAHEPATLLTGNKPVLKGLNDVEQMMALDMLTYLPDDILTKVDRAAMGVSLETRVPFLDHRVVEFAWSMPLEYKLRREGRGYTTKWALRQVLYRYVPKELIERPKMGFGIPIDSWLRGPLRDWAEALLNESRLKREGYLNPGPIRQRWDEHLSGRRNWQHSLWCVLMFQAWLETQELAVQ